MNTRKQLIIGLSLGLLFSITLWVLVFYSAKPKLDQHGRVVAPPPPTYPFMDQVKMDLVLKPDEKLFSVQHINPGYVYIVTLVMGPPMPNREFRVYTGIIGDRGVMINQPTLWYTIHEQ